MSTLTVTWQGVSRTLSPGDELTFGRDPRCSIVLDPEDRGLSRRFGLVHHDGATWWVVNESTKRSLHIVYGTGLSEPLPVAADGWPPARRPVDGQVRVLVPGFAWTHELLLASEVRTARAASRPSDLQTTMSQLPPMTDNRREALVALAWGYLQPFPRYDPRPRTYADAAALLDARPAQIRKRIESLRAALVAAGVTRLGADDARRELVEWALSMRFVSPRDADWLQERMSAGRMSTDVDET